MRPLKLDLCGFTCFREPQSLDFTDLELFAIVGQTGAGKSSLLDAITYALYGETARLGSRGLEALVSQGATSMYVTLEFEVRADDRFRVSRVWSLKAAERQIRFERLEADRWVAATPSTRVADINKAVVDLVGLDYQGFTRAILLPQGEFDRFLRGEASERRELLKGLIGLDRIDQMRRRADEQARDLKSNISQRNSLLENEYLGITPEALEGCETKLVTLEDDIKGFKTGLETTRKKLGEAHEVAGILDELRGTRDRVLGLEEGRSAVLAGADRAARARRVASVWPRAEALTRAERASEDAQSDVKRNQSALEESTQAEAKARERFQAARESARSLTGLLMAREKLLEVRPRLERLKALGGHAGLSRADALPFDEATIGTVQALEGRTSTWTNLSNQGHFLDQDEGRAKARIEEARAAFESSRGEQARLIEEGQNAKERVAHIETQIEEVRRSLGAAVLVRGLTLGDPCPVCGEPLKRIPEMPPSELPALEAGLVEAREAYGVMQDKYRGFAEQAKTAQRDIQESQEAMGRFEERRNDLNKQIKELSDEFEAVVGPFRDPAASLRDLRERLAAGLAKEISEATGGINPEEKLAELNQRTREIEQEEDEAQEALSECKANAAASKVALEAAKRDLERQQREVSDRKLELDAALASLGLASVVAAQDLAMPEHEIASLEDAAKHHNEAVIAAQSEIARLERKLEGRSLDDGGVVKMQERLSELEMRLSEATLEQGRALSERERLVRGLESVKRLRREKAEFEKQYDTFASLAYDLKGDQFQEYLLSRVQQELLARASAIMREVTRDRYTLALQDKQYMVLDNWNGLESRSVKTLSGGESFIASLSLALALSDYLAGHRALGALFLDEGFGTLDSEALESVAAVLETIQTQGRMVGVITHVSSLAERLPVRLMVEKSISSSRVHWDGL